MTSNNILFHDRASTTSICSAENEQHKEEDEEEPDDGADCDACNSAWIWTILQIGICGWYHQDLLLSLDD